MQYESGPRAREGYEVELSLSRCCRCRIAMSDDRQNDAVRSAHGRAAITTRSVDALRQYMIIPAGVSPREFLVPYSLMQADNAAIEADGDDGGGESPMATFLGVRKRCS